ncbi:MAG TPA: hypothetical protein VGR64_06950 [Terracidiphilus sp.]|nr:hypothetical protein [Terracidiphilus sp.]
MRSDRVAIWRLLAMGRISANEAERLLAESRRGAETAWIVAGFAAAALLVEWHGVRLLPGSLENLASAAKTVAQWMGGMR